MFKGLVNYPVFILTLVSILAISYLSLHLLEKIHSSIVSNSVYEKQLDKPEYVLENNELYIKLVSNSIDHLIQISLFLNNTLKIHRLSRIGSIYGPIILTNDTAEVLIIHPFDKTIVDHIVIGDIEREVAASIEEYLPPSINIYLGKQGLNYLESINKSSIFYRLKSISYTRSILINKNRVYRVSSSDVVINETDIPLILLNTSIIKPDTLDQRLNQLIDTYGYVIEYRKYLLNLYSYSNIYLSSRTIYYSRLITTNPQCFTYTLSLNNIVFDQDVLINTSVFNKVNQVIVRDIYGYTYVANITMKFWLVINSSFRIFLGIVRFNTNELPSVVLNNYSFTDSGLYNPKILIEYEVYVLQPVFGPVYFTINHVIYGGFENKLFIKTYLYDKLSVDLGYSIFNYRPIVNNTIVEFNVTCFQNTSGLFFILNNKYVSNYFSTQYNGLNNVYIVDWIKPNALLITPIYIDIIGISNSKHYVLNTSVLDKTHGVYIIGDYSTGVLLFNPFIYLDSEYIVFRSSSEIVLLITKNRVVLVEKSSYSFHSVIKDIHGFLVVEKNEYYYPIICISNPYGLTISLNLRYINSSVDTFRLNNSSCVFIENTVLSRIEISVVNSFIGKYIYSFTSDSILFIHDYSKLYSIRNLFEIYILNHKFKLCLLDNGFYILI